MCIDIDVSRQSTDIYLCRCRCVSKFVVYSLYAIQMMLGHEDIDTTAGYVDDRWLRTIRRDSAYSETHRHKEPNAFCAKTKIVWFSKKVMFCIIL